MALNGQVDPEILQEFITESMELLDGMDQDLVKIEQEPDNPELLNRIFRAMHTIKGSSSFLSLNPMTDFAHAAEEALNTLRKTHQDATPEIMDLLLAASDTLRQQLDSVKAGQMPMPGSPILIDKLHKVGAGEERESSIVRPVAPKPSSVEEPDTPSGLQLSDSKLDLLPFMIDDLEEAVQNIRDLLDQIEDPQEIPATAAQLREITQGLMRSVGFFEIDHLNREIQALDTFANALAKLQSEALHQAKLRVRALLDVIAERAAALRSYKLLNLPTEVLIERLSMNLVGQVLDQAAQLVASASAEDVLIADGVHLTDDAPAAWSIAGFTDPPLPASTPADDGKTGKSQADQTIRVDVARLETLLNLVGELILQKNRVASMTRRLADERVGGELQELMNQVASDLDRVTSELQIGVMKTRMQPLSKVFSRFPRLMRDLARTAGKQIDLVIDGGDTEVDKSVIELLGDPLVHILRNSADHGIEMPEQRTQVGKPPQGVVHIKACHEGNHVLVEVRDDGRGLNTERIGKRAVERGLLTPDELKETPSSSLFELIFAPGFSTAENVSALSGRGVGMDVVKTNITKLGGMVEVNSQPGLSTTVRIRIPLTIAIMQAMMVGLGDETYAIPLSHLVEIVKPEEHARSSINGCPVIRLRERILPLIDLRRLFGSPTDSQASAYAVVVGVGADQAGLLVDRLIGQEEVVIKPMDSLFNKSELVSGATIREDGDVSLILDIAALVKVCRKGR